MSSLSNLHPSVLLKISETLSARNIASLASSSKKMNFFKIKVKLIMFNGTAKTYEQDPITIYYGRLFTSGSVKVPTGVREISLLSSKFQKLVSITREYGEKKLKDGTPAHIRFQGESFAITVSKFGNITFTGGYTTSTDNLDDRPKKLLKYVLGSVKNYELNNVTIQCNIGYGINLQKLSYILGGKANLNPEIKPYLKYDDKYQYRIFATGYIQISKITSIRNIDESIKHISNLLIESDVLVGKYNPNRKSIKPRQTKSQARRNNQIAPNVKRYATTCPEDRRPTPYSFAGVPIEGHYVGMTKQGDPCCYRIPKKTAYLKPKIIEQFKAKGIRIPPYTRQIFGITLRNYNNTNSPINVSGKNNTNLIFTMAPRVKKNTKNLVFKIGTRQCTRWTIAQLTDIAQKMGIPISKGSTKEEICSKIQQRAIETGRMVNKSNIIKGNNVRLGGKRNASHFTKDELANRAFQEYKIRLNKSQTLKNMVKNLKDHVKQVRLEKMLREYEIPEKFWNIAKDDMMNKSMRDIRNILSRASKNVKNIQEYEEGSRMAGRRSLIKNIYNSVINTNILRKYVPLEYANINNSNDENAIRNYFEFQKNMYEMAIQSNQNKERLIKNIYNSIITNKYKGVIPLSNYMNKLKNMNSPANIRKVLENKKNEYRKFIEPKVNVLTKKQLKEMGLLEEL